MMESNSGERRVLQLTNAQRQTLESFTDITQISDEFLVIQILTQHGWDLERALNAFITGENNPGEEDVVPMQSSEPGFGSGTSRRRPSSNPVNTSNAGTSNPNLSNASSTLPNNSNDRRPTTAYSHGGITDLLTVPLRWLFQSRPISLNPHRDTLTFIDEYNESYGNNHPTFHAGAFQSAVANAFSQSKLLLGLCNSSI